MNVFIRTVERLGNEKWKIVILQGVAILTEAYLPVMQIALLGSLVSGLILHTMDLKLNMLLLALYLMSLWVPSLVVYWREKLMLIAKDNITLNFEREVINKVSRASILTRFSALFNDKLGNVRLNPGTIYSILEGSVNCLVLVLTCVFLLINLASTYWLLPVVLLVVGVALFPLMRKAHQSYWKLIFSQSRESNIVNTLSGTIFSKSVFIEMKIYGHFNWAMNYWLRHYRNYRMRNFKESIKYKTRLRCYNTVLRITPVALILSLIALQISDIKTVVVFMGTLQVIIAKFTDLMNKTNRLQNQLTEYLKADEFTAQSFPQNKHLDTPPSDTEQIVCSEVTFHYPDQPTPALHQINIKLSKGQIICIVGENGSGKTSLIHLLLGLFDPTSGQISYETKPQGSLQPDPIVPKATALFQHYLRLASDIRDNVAIGDIDHAEDSEILRALREAKADFAIELGLDTSLDREFGGRNLSGGEWQRIGLARSMLQKEGVIVLDEPTAALDPIAEIDVYSTLIDKYKNRTIILVSHRMTATVLADLVIVMSKGKIIEQGSHKALMNNEGVYYNMFQAQAAPYLVYYHTDPGWECLP